jgi:uroporphyrinogen-III synthase
MKRILLKMIFGVTLMSIFYLGLSWLINKVRIADKRAACWINPQFQRKGGQEFRLMKDWDPSAKYDVLVVGSSHAYRGYDPREFEKYNLKLFAAGSGFQNTLATYILSKDVFRPTKNSLVIIDLFDQTFVGDGGLLYTRYRKCG